MVLGVIRKVKIQKGDDSEVPVTIIQSILREHLEDNRVAITELKVVCPEEFKKASYGGGNLFRAEVFWDSGSKSDSASWVVKHWRPGGVVGTMMGVDLPVESLAWNHGLLGDTSLPENMVVPFIGTRHGKKLTDAWIVMEDVTSELGAFRSIQAHNDNLKKPKFILDRLACFHSNWEKPDRLAELEKYSWLLQQNRYLWAGADLASLFLGRKPREAKKYPSHPIFEMAEKAVLAFLDWLPEDDRSLWQKHMCNREALVEAHKGLPQTLLHGDLSLPHIGLRWEKDNPEILLIDWELLGIGSAAIDVATYINRALDFEGGINNGTETLPDYYYDRYKAHGGTAFDRTTWERAYNLAYILEYLWQFPLHVGFLDSDRNLTNQENEPAGAKAIKQKAEQATDAIKKWLR